MYHDASSFPPVPARAYSFTYPRYAQYKRRVLIINRYHNYTINYIYMIYLTISR